ncbi:protein mono-ADP-ribosyltransferase PARP10 [Tiliqua scincoides]|uniref:protein mono-ADP-ribosyltransferase PARP10 n=1 Tax=Tiliqua scincoides TaxID=71010 RepID=UPI0034627167
MAEEVAVAVRGVPAGVADELLVLYFENRRRSGGGPVRSCRRWDSRAVLHFESAQDARRVLSRPEHCLQDARLLVEAAAPRDDALLLLRGLSPRSSLDLVELYVERLLDCERGRCSVLRSPAGDRALVRLPEPLGHAEFLALAEQVQNRPLDEASLTLDWVEQTDSLLVRSGGGHQLNPALLELYFESKRSGGGPVRAVRLLPGGAVAVVSFQDRAAVARVLQKPHVLQDDRLDVCPHYEFLEPVQQEQEQGPATALLLDSDVASVCIALPEAATRRLLEAEFVLRQLRASFPECTIQLDGGGLHVSGKSREQQQLLQAQVQAVLQDVVQESLPFSTWVLNFLRREDVQGRLAELLAKQEVGACYVPGVEEVLVLALNPAAARHAATLLEASLCPISLPLSEQHILALASPCWAQLQTDLRCCLVRLAESGEHLEGLTLRGMEQENLARLADFLQDTVPDEVVVPMEAATLRYLQLYCHELLAGMASLTLLPLEGPDITGLRLSGEAQACRAAAELLESLISATHTQVVHLQLPGVNRFLLDRRGQSLVQELEKRFRCTIGLERVHWSPVEAQHKLEMSQEPLVLSCRRDSPRGLEQPGSPLGGVAGEQSGANIEKIRDLLAALRPAAAPPPAEGEPEEEEEDLYCDPEQQEAAAPLAAEEEGSMALEPIEGGPLPDSESSSVDEEAELLLAIQKSIDSAREEDAELQRAKELSLRSYQLEQEQELGPDPPLLSALGVSLEDVPLAADLAELVVCTGVGEEVAPLTRELEAVLRAQLQEETVRHKALRSSSACCLGYLAHLEQKHAVRISLADSVATVCGFVDYPVAATRDLALLLTRLLQDEGPRASGGVCWIRWEPFGGSSPTPYSAQASALLEQAWRRGHKHVDVFFDGRPFTIDFERMEEYDIGNARALPIGRTEPPVAPPATPASDTALAEDKVTLVPLVEGSEEFRETVRRFYDTLEDLHNKIRIVKVEKLLHPLLYQQYQLKKAAMEKACGHRDVERLLYHGTTEQSSREICQLGFNRSFCGKNATRYGHGVYFASRAAISVQDQYSPCSKDGNKYIFVTRTLTGDYAAGHQDLRAPPLREDVPTPRRYDSVVDNPRSPSIFVVFHDTQAYPQYLITCQWSRPH